MKSFLQSSAWMSFQKSLGRKVWQVDGINIIKHNLPLGKSYLYSPRYGNNFLPHASMARGLSESFLEKIREIAKKENAIFFKIELQKQVDKKLLKKFGFRKGKNIQPGKTLILDITKSEKELLKEMYSKTRYNIRLAEKKGVEIRIDNNKFKSFWKLLEQTAKKDGFHTHAKEYYKKILDVPGVELFLALNPPARDQTTTKVIAANIVLFFEKTVSQLRSGQAPRLHSGQAIYLHGASDYKYRSLMAPYLLQWQQILEAKKRGCIEYDFWGIDEKKWPGITRFKKGFSGREIDYIGAYDLIFQPIWYKLYKLARKIL